MFLLLLPDGDDSISFTSGRSDKLSVEDDKVFSSGAGILGKSLLPATLAKERAG